MHKKKTIRQKLLASILTLAMVFGMMPMMTMEVEASTPPSGYTTNENNQMAYSYKNGYLDLQGKFNDEWKQTTFVNRGFTTVIKVGGTTYNVQVSEGNAVAIAGTGLTVAIEPIFQNGGNNIRFSYTVTNTSSRAVTYSIASGADVKIGSDDRATIQPIPGGFKMISTKATDKNDSGEYAQFNMFYGYGDDGTAHPNVTPVDTCWYGHYGQYRNNYFNDLTHKNTLSGVDSGVAWSWKDETVSGNSSKTHSIMFSIGGPGSEVISNPEYIISYSSTIAKPNSQLAVPDADGVYPAITLPTPTASGYEFLGWYSDENLITPVNNTTYTPTSDVTFYAKWKEIESPVEISVTKDDANWAGLTGLTLYQGGYYKHALTEVGNVYKSNVVNGSYDIYKDGVDTGKDVVVNSTATSGDGETVTVSLEYTTLKTTAMLDDAPKDMGVVDYRIDRKQYAPYDDNNGNYTYIVASDNPNSYDVYIDAKDSMQDISVVNNTINVDYFTAVADVKLDGSAYSGRTVVFSRTEGDATYYYTPTYENDKYSVVLPAGANNDYQYTVTVDGRNVGTVSNDSKSVTPKYYTSHIDIQKDSVDWINAEVYLQNGDVKHKLTYKNGEYQTILYADSEVYDVLVHGTNSPELVGVKVQDDTSKTVSFWTVDFLAKDGSSYTKRIIQDGKTVAKPSTPEVTGYSFNGWYKENSLTNVFDFTSPITTKTTVYPKYSEPQVLINSIVQNSASEYTMPNLSITGFPADKADAVKQVILSVNNGNIAVGNAENYTVTGSGTQSVTLTFGSGTSMETAQRILRSVTISGATGAHTLNVTIGGDTSASTVSDTSDIKISPVTLELDGGQVNSGNISFYQEDVGASLPTDVSKVGHTFNGWNDNATEISTSATGAQTFTAQWIAGGVDLGTAQLTGSGLSFKFPNANINATDGMDNKISSLSLTITDGTVAVEAGSGYTVTTNLTDTNATIAFLTMQTVADVESILRDKVTFTKTNTTDYPVVSATADGNTTILPDGITGNLQPEDEIKFTDAGNGHYYMYVPYRADTKDDDDVTHSDGVKWTTAYNLAKSYYYKGMQGYLVTITSEAEDKILDNLYAGGGWSAGTRLSGDEDVNDWAVPTAEDPPTVNHWRWACGPEAGQTYMNVATTPENFNGSIYIGYRHWGWGTDGIKINSEPNYSTTYCNLTGEQCMQVHYPSLNQWNDMNWKNLQVKGFFVEFGGYAEGADPGGGTSADKTVTGSATVKAYAPTIVGVNVYANGSAVIISGTNVYWDENSNGVVDSGEDKIGTVSENATIYAGTSSSFAEPEGAGQITLINAAVKNVDKGNAEKPIVVNLEGNVSVSDGINVDEMIVTVLDTLTNSEQIKLKTSSGGDTKAGRPLAYDASDSAVIDMSKFTLNNGNNAITADGKWLEISSYGVNITDNLALTILSVPPSYATATVNITENGILTDVTSVVLKPESGDSITLNRSAEGTYSYQALENNTIYNLYVDDVAFGDTLAFATGGSSQTISHYTAEVSYNVNDIATNASSVVLKAVGKSDISMTAKIDQNGDLVSGVYTYRGLEDPATSYSVWVNGEDSVETLRLTNGENEKTLNRYSTEITLQNNESAWIGQSVTLRDTSGAIIYTLGESATGIYSALTNSSATESYSIYVGTENSGQTITPSADEKSAVTLSYVTATVTTNKDDAASSLGTVTVDGKVARETTNGNYKVTLPDSNLEVLVNGINVGNVTASSPTIEADFYTVTYNSADSTGEIPTDQNIYYKGETVTALPYGTLGKTDHSFAGWSDGSDTYNVGDTFAIDEKTTLTAQWVANADAEVSWQIPGELDKHGNQIINYGSFDEALEDANNTELPVHIEVQNDLSIDENAEIPSNATVDIPKDKTVTVESGKTLNNNGTINNNGTLTGDGTLTNNGTLDNTSPPNEANGQINLDTDNTSGQINGGIVGADGSIDGGEITGNVTNTGEIINATINGDVTNNGDINTSEINGNVDNNNTIDDSTINGNAINNGTINTTTINGNVDTSGGSASGLTVNGTTTAKGGNINTPQELVEALGGSAYIDDDGTVVLTSDVQLDDTITINSDVNIDLNGHNITGPNGSDNESGEGADGKPAIEVKDNSNVNITDSQGGGTIQGGSGGAGGNSNTSGNGGTGLVADGNSTVTIGENVTIEGGSGGRSTTDNNAEPNGTSGTGGTGIEINSNAEVTVNGNVIGGDGGSNSDAGNGGSAIVNNGKLNLSETGNLTGGDGGEIGGGDGGTGLVNEGSGAVNVDGEIAGGNGGSGEIGGNGGTGLVNGGSGAVNVDGEITGGNGGIGEIGGNEGSSMSGEISYLVKTDELTHLVLDDTKAKVVVTENGKILADTEIGLKPIFENLYDLPTTISISVNEQVLDSANYTYDAQTGVVEIKQDTSATDSIFITAQGIEKSGPVTVTDKDELNYALENNFNDIVVNDNISLDEEITVPSGTTVTVSDGKTLDVNDNGKLTNNGTIKGDGDIIVKNGGELVNKGELENNKLTIETGGVVTNHNEANISTTQDVVNAGTLTNDGIIEKQINNSGTVNQVDGAPVINVSGGTTNDPVWKISYDMSGIGTKVDALLAVTALPNPLPLVANTNNYTFNGWFVDSALTEEAVANTQITGNTVLYASWTYIGSSSGSSSDSSDNDIVVKDPVTNNENSESSTTITVDPTTSGGVSKVDIPSSYMDEAVESALEKAADDNTAPKVIIEVDTPSSADSVEVTFDSDVLGTLTENNDDATIEITSDVGGMTFDREALNAIAEAANGADITLVIRKVENESELTEAQKAVVSDAPTYELYIESNGKRISDFRGGNVTVNVPEELEVDENSEVLVYYIADNGDVEAVSTSYNSEDNTVTFITKHFSHYVIQVVDKANPSTGDLPFTDVPTDAWYFEDVIFVYINDIMQGTSDTTFEPNIGTTRAMMAQVIWNMEGNEAINSTSVYSDVSNNEWYSDAIAWTSENGIYKGFGDGTFRPNDNITREQLVAILYRYAEYKGYNLTPKGDLSQFADGDKVSDWGAEDMMWAIGSELIFGKGDGNLDPKGTATRAEIAAMLHRFMKIN